MWFQENNVSLCLKLKNMTNYQNDIMDLIPGETPKQKYDNLEKVFVFLQMMTTPRRGMVEENWDVYEAVNYCNANTCVKEIKDLY